VSRQASLHALLYQHRNMFILQSLLDAAAAGYGTLFQCILDAQKGAAPVSPCSSMYFPHPSILTILYTLIPQLMQQWSVARHPVNAFPMTQKFFGLFLRSELIITCAADSAHCQ
jgi:hypothetical protein